jgi:glucosylceramidase
MNRIRMLAVGLYILIMAGCRNSPDAGMTGSGEQTLSPWITTSDAIHLLEKQPEISFSGSARSSVLIEADTSKKFQVMEGFGYALTGGSAMVLKKQLSENIRKKLLQELFSTDADAIGISYLRITIGGSDLDELLFTYNDLPAGENDLQLNRFSLAYDTLYLIPVLKEILEINPTIKIMASPWTAPVWMKTNQKFKGGSLMPEYYKVYANYFVRYIQEMSKHGITIHAVTPQNEPENPNNTPSLVMTSGQQLVFIRDFLAPAFVKNSIGTEIIIFDHNADHPEYPLYILNNSVAKASIAGTAFHLYLGEINALSQVYEQHPDKKIYFTEQWTSATGNFGGDLGWHIKNLIIGASRNYSVNVLEWNLANDANFGPHTNDGGCNLCQGALTLDADKVKRNVSYYIIAHASKFVPPGSRRIYSSQVNGLPNVAFLTPEGKRVMIVLSERPAEIDFDIKFGDQFAQVNLQPGSVATLTW